MSGVGDSEWVSGSGSDLGGFVGQNPAGHEAFSLVALCAYLRVVGQVG